MTHVFLAYFDDLGFETIIDLTKIDQKANWSFLKGEEPKFNFNLNHLFLRARLNPHRSPEIWRFASELSEDELKEYATTIPYDLIRLIREKGENIFV